MLPGEFALEILSVTVDLCKHASSPPFLKYCWLAQKPEGYIQEVGGRYTEEHYSLAALNFREEQVTL